MTRRPPPSIRLQRRGQVATVTVDRPEVRNALAPATIRSRALDLLLTGCTIGARKALDIGFVDRVVPPRHGARGGARAREGDRHEPAADAFANIEAVRARGIDVDRFAPRKPESRMFRFGNVCGGHSLTREEPLDNIARVARFLEVAGAGKIRLVVGGVIPDEDIPALRGLDAGAVYPPAGRRSRRSWRPSAASWDPMRARRSAGTFPHRRPAT
jgi:hypothetical protein